MLQVIVLTMFQVLLVVQVLRVWVLLVWMEVQQLHQLGKRDAWVTFFKTALSGKNSRSMV